MRRRLVLLTLVTLTSAALAPSPAGAMVTTRVVCDGAPESFAMMVDTLTISFSATELRVPRNAADLPDGIHRVPGHRR